MFEEKLKIDIDEKKMPRDFFSTLETLEKYAPIKLYRITRSKNKGFHVKLNITGNMNDYEKLLLQCLLGSDIKRELMNYMRYKVAGDFKTWNFLFDEKYI